MEPTEFITSLRQRVILNDNTNYQKLLNSNENATDPLWKDVLELYRKLNNDEKELFVQFLRLIQVNSVSHILRILDGSTYLDEKRESFILSSESDGSVLNGDLQDLFLEIEEDEEK